MGSGAMREQYTPTAPVVSVVMFVDDAEKTVRRAIESLQRQTLKNFEVICVVRSSSDGCERMVRSIGERDMRVMCVRGGNYDRNTALNTGLGRALGKYLLVMDADGWLEPNTLEELVEAAEKDDLELVVGGWALLVSIADGRSSAVEIAADSHVFASQDEFRSESWRLFATGQMLPASAKLFKIGRIRELGLRFDEDATTDHGFVVDYLRDIERVGIVGGIGYRLERMLLPQSRGYAGPAGFRELEAEYDALCDLYGHWGLSEDAQSVQMVQTRYIEQLAGCVENACGWGTALTSAEQKKLVTTMIGSDRAQHAASVAKPQGNSARSLLAPMRSNNVALICVQARLMSLIRRGAVPEVVPDAFL